MKIIKILPAHYSYAILYKKFGSWRHYGRGFFAKSQSSKFAEQVSKQLHVGKKDIKVVRVAFVV